MAWIRLTAQSADQNRQNVVVFRVEDVASIIFPAESSSDQIGVKTVHGDHFYLACSEFRRFLKAIVHTDLDMNGDLLHELMKWSEGGAAAFAGPRVEVPESSPVADPGKPDGGEGAS